METENMTVEVLETKRRSETKAYKAECGTMRLAADVTTLNDTVSGIDDIRIYDGETNVWVGSANPNISGSFLRSGNEPEVMQLIASFISFVKQDK